MQGAARATIKPRIREIKSYFPIGLWQLLSKAKINKLTPPHNPVGRTLLAFV